MIPTRSCGSRGASTPNSILRRLAALLAAACVAGFGSVPAAAQPAISVVGQGDESVTSFSLTDNGNVPPLRKISGPATQLGSPFGIAVDHGGSELVVTDTADPWSVRWYPLAATGNTAPARVISGPATELSDPFGVAVDSGRGEIYVANQVSDAITVYDRPPGGGDPNRPPKRKIQGPFTGLTGPWGIALDLVHDEIFVANRGSNIVSVFARTAGGAPGSLDVNAVAKRNIAGGNTKLASPQGVAVDPLHGIIAVANGGGGGSSSVTLYRRAETSLPFSNVPPFQTLTGFTNAVGVAFDPATGVLLVTDSDFFVGNPPPTANRILVFGRAGSKLGGSYTQTPIRTIGGAATTLSTPMFLAVTTPPAPLATTGLVAAVLPLSRSVRTFTQATAFVTIINSGPVTAYGVGISRAQPTPGGFAYQATDPLTNLPITAANFPMDIPPGEGQSFVIIFSPTAPFGPIDLAFNFAGVNTVPVPPLSGINTLLISASATPVPDVIALAATPSNDGVAQLPGVGVTGAFSVATSNVGSGDTIRVSADTGATALPLGVLVCQTDPVTAQCISALGATVDVFIAASGQPGSTPTFSFFATATGAISFDPALHRIFVRFTGSDGVIRGMTAVAVTTQ